MCESPLKCCVYGCGAIGLDLAVHLIKAGHAVTLVARGETFTALRDRGIEHVDSTGLRTEIKPGEFRLQQTETMEVVQDLVFLTVKADALTTIAHEVSPLLSEDSIVVSATNGIPPWYSYKQDGTIGRFLKDVSVREKFLRHIPAEHIIGATIERSASRSAPRTVSQTFGAGYVIGEPTHKVTDRLEKLRCLLEQSGLSARMSDNIHSCLAPKTLRRVFLLMQYPSAQVLAVFQ